MSTDDLLAATGFDALALKPTEVDLDSVTDHPPAAVVLDYEGPAAYPDADTLDRLARVTDLRVTVPIRAEGFDPLGDDHRWGSIPEMATLAVVAGNPAYLTADERRRPIGPRLEAALDRAPNAWVGTEGIEGLARETSATPFELLSPGTDRRVRALRADGFDGEVAVYTPTVLSAAPDDRLDALGSYLARRRPVSRALPASSPTDANATGQAREVLLGACDDYAITGGLESVGDRIEELRAVGVDHVVGYPARGLGVARDGHGIPSRR